MAEPGAHLAVPQESARAEQLPPSGIRRMFTAVERVRAAGEEVIPLHIGDPDFELPPRVIEAICGALEQGRTHYSPAAGIRELREAVASYTAGRLELGAPEELSAAHTVISPGATQALNNCLQLCCNAGEGILLPEVHFPNYIQQTALAGVRAQLYPLDAHFQPRLDALDSLVDNRTRALLINTPGNPAGALFPPETIRELYRFARRHNLWLISDEAYIDFVYEGDYLSPLQLDWEHSALERRVLAVFSFSKSYAATGLRCGWTVCPSHEAAHKLGLMNEPQLGCMTTPVQWGMIAALAEDDTAERRASLDKRRRLAARVLSESGVPVRPVDGGMFYFIDISATDLSCEKFADRLLESERVAVVPGSSFGLEPTYRADGGVRFTPTELASRHVRLCFAIDEQLLTEGLTRLARFIKQHTG